MKRSRARFAHQAVLVTGGAGFVGANLVRRLLEEGARLHLIVKPSTELWRLEAVQNRLTLHTVSLTDFGTLKRLCEHIRPRYVFHLAAHGAYSHQTDPQEIVGANVVGTTNLLVALRDGGCQGFVHAGTSSEYGFKRRPMKESDLLEPTSYYAATKAAATHLGQVFARIENLPVVTLRLFSLFGPWEEPRRLMPAIIARALRGEPLLLTQGRERHDFVWVGDAVEAFLLAARKAHTLKGKIFNVGTGRQYTIRQLASQLQKILGPLDCHWGAYPGHGWDSTFWVADPSLAGKKLGWRAKTALPEGLHLMTEWLKAHRKYYDT